MSDTLPQHLCNRATSRSEYCSRCVHGRPHTYARCNSRRSCAARHVSCACVATVRNYKELGRGK